MTDPDCYNCTTTPGVPGGGSDTYYKRRSGGVVDPEPGRGAAHVIIRSDLAAYYT